MLEIINKKCVVDCIGINYKMCIFHLFENIFSILQNNLVQLSQIQRIALLNRIILIDVFLLYKVIYEQRPTKLT